MSEEARVWAKRQKAPCAMSKAVLLELADMANTDGTCWPSIRLLADRFGISTRQVQRHIAKLKECKLIVSEDRWRENGGQSSNLYRFPLSEAYAFDSSYFTPGDVNVVGGDDVTDVGGATSASPHEEKTLTTDISKEISRGRSGKTKGFEEFWQAYPRKIEKRAAEAIYRRAISKGGVSDQQLVQAARAYASAVQGRDEAMIKSPTTWLSRYSWLDENEAVSAPANPPATPLAQHASGFPGPADLRKAVVFWRGEGWTKLWLDPCGWDESKRELIPRFMTGRDQLQRELWTVLREMNVSVGEPPKGRAA